MKYAVSKIYSRILSLSIYSLTIGKIVIMLKAIFTYSLKNKYYPKDERFCGIVCWNIFSHVKHYMKN